MDSVDPDHFEMRDDIAIVNYDETAVAWHPGYAKMMATGRPHTLLKDSTSIKMSTFVCAHKDGSIVFEKIIKHSTDTVYLKPNSTHTMQPYDLIWNNIIKTNEGIQQKRVEPVA